MWIVDGGKQAHLIQCTNYECMCKFYILDEEIIQHSWLKFKFVRCPICKKEIRLIDAKEEA